MSWLLGVIPQILPLIHSLTASGLHFSNKNPLQNDRVCERVRESRGERKRGLKERKRESVKETEGGMEKKESVREMEGWKERERESGEGGGGYHV